MTGHNTGEATRDLIRELKWTVSQGKQGERMSILGMKRVFYKVKRGKGGCKSMGREGRR